MEQCMSDIERFFLKYGLQVASDGLSGFGIEMVLKGMLNNFDHKSLT